ncbi:MAG: ATP-binding protein [Ignavibacteria bacterium]|nr:ATP-binding protein [Ignavibacteria bacterium]
MEFNNKAMELYEYSSEELKNLPLSKLQAHSTEELIKDEIKNLNTEQGVVYESYHIAKSGRVFAVEISAKMVRLNGGNYYVQMIRDIEARKKIEHELQLARVKAEESDRLKSNFLSMISHEVRTPLNVILGSIEFIRDTIPESVFPGKLNFFDMIRRNSDRLMNLIDDIIDISRLEAREMSLNLAVREVKSLTQDIITQYEDYVKEKGLVLVTNYWDEQAYIKVDETRFKQIFLKLLNNAIKFTAKGGITITTSVVDGEVRISIKDTGIGIPDEFKNSLFEIFRQADEGYKRSFEGAGLSLAIANKLTRLMGGRIEAESEVNKGSTFTLVFPSIKIGDFYDTDLANQIIKKSDEKTRRTYKVLIVEDNKDNAIYLEFLLSRIGLNYETAYNGTEALEFLSKSFYDVVLMDINLIGNISGEDLLDFIRKQESLLKTKVVAITAYSNLGDRQRFLSRGFDEYILKPFSIEALGKILFKLLADTKSTANEN